VTDAVGFDGFYADSYQRVVTGLRLATRSPDEAEDLAQEAFARTLARWSRVRSGANPVGYVFRTAFRLDRRNRFRRRRQHDAATAEAHRDSRLSAGATDRRDEVAAVRDALASLPLARRRAAVLCLYAELTAEEAAVVLGVSASTVRTQVQRARQALRAAVDLDPEPREDAVA
jgi:RNA polymerase sigma factor (sigma-70 family)